MTQSRAEGRTVSVLLAVHDGAAYMEQAIRSVMAQSYPS